MHLFSIRGCPTEVFSEEWEARFPLILFISTAWLQLSCCVELSQPLRDEWVDPVGPKEHNGRLDRTVLKLPGRWKWRLRVALMRHYFCP